MKCPKCKDSVLIRPLPPTQESRVRQPHACTECGGLWVTREEMDSHDGVFTENPSLEPDADLPFDPDKRTGLCPLGHGLLIRARMDLDPPFFLERCSACGGIWFDKGEWNRVAENHLIDNLSDFWTSAWQRKQRQEKNRQTYLEMNKSVLGPDLYEEILRLADTLRDHPEKLRAMALLRQEILESEKTSE